ncbi:hypothetical protein [Desulfoluna sp.]|uniref:hypothetical protein n=1 Tax=Desulfoluna sp. TaxID=2045199 RepID=UPI00260364D2|nr:hypothetical protein [Desulfoluna sp.]
MNRNELMAKREELIKRREALKLKRKREDRLSRLDDLGNYLDAHRIAYTLRLDDEAFAWIAETFPYVFSGIDWDKVPGATKIWHGSDDERDRLISTLLATHLLPSDVVVVTFGNADTPSIELQAEAVIHYTALFADEDEDIWVTESAKGFCLESYHEGYVGVKAGQKDCF